MLNWLDWFPRKQWKLCKLYCTLRVAKSIHNALKTHWNSTYLRRARTIKIEVQKSKTSYLVDVWPIKLYSKHTKLVASPTKYSLQTLHFLHNIFTECDGAKTVVLKYIRSQRFNKTFPRCRMIYFNGISQNKDIKEQKLVLWKSQTFVRIKAAPWKVDKNVWCYVYVRM